MNIDAGILAGVVPLFIIGALFLCCLSDWLSGRFVDNDEDDRARRRSGHHERQEDE
jgi:hypothetical protein